MARSTKKQYAEALHKKAIKQSRERFMPFVQYTFGPDYQVNWHHRLIAQVLEKFVKGEIDRLIINCPPRHGKTELCSRRLPAWIIGRDPDAKIIACSYGQDLANENSVDVKKIVRSDRYKNVFPQLKLPTKEITRARGDKHLRNKQELWEIVDNDGRYLAKGVGGGITGKGGDYLLLDDPIKDDEQAQSKDQREKVWAWFQKVFRTRANKDARILVIQTRWHKDDPVGRIKNEMREIEHAPEWTIFNFPAIYREGVNNLHPEDPREPGEALWPWYRTREDWLAAEQMDPEGFQALHQGMPRPPGGAMIKEDWIKKWTELPQGPKEWLWAIDPKGGSEKRKASEAVIQLWCRDKDRETPIYLVDQEKGVWSQGKTEQKVRELNNKLPWKRASTKLMENKGDGPGIKEHVADEVPGIVMVEPWADKEQRVRDVESYWRAGDIRVPDNDPMTPGPQGRNFRWVDEFLNQHTSFPGSDKDDQVDASTYAIDHLLGSRGDTTPGESVHYLERFYGDPT